MKTTGISCVTKFRLLFFLGHPTVHPIQIGLRMVAEFRMRVKENIEADPLRAVAKVYEEELTRIKEQLGEGLDEFIAACLTLIALSPSMYR